MVSVQANYSPFLAHLPVPGTYLNQLTNQTLPNIAKQEARKVTAGAGAGASTPTPTELIKGDPVLHALHRASRQLVKLRETLLKQVRS